MAASSGGKKDIYWCSKYPPPIPPWPCHVTKPGGTAKKKEVFFFGEKSIDTVDAKTLQPFAQAFAGTWQLVNKSSRTNQEYDETPKWKKAVEAALKCLFEQVRSSNHAALCAH